MEFVKEIGLGERNREGTNCDVGKKERGGTKTRGRETKVTLDREGERVEG